MIVRPSIRRIVPCSIALGVVLGLVAVVIGSADIAGGIAVAIVSGFLFLVFALAAPALGLEDHINTGDERL